MDEEAEIEHLIGVYNNFFNTIMMLAAPFEIQINLFSKGALLGDEMALAFDAEAFIHLVFLFEGKYISERQYSIVKMINDELESFNQKSSKDIWGAIQVENSPEWENIRDLANEVAKEFNLPEDYTYKKYF